MLHTVAATALAACIVAFATASVAAAKTPTEHDLRLLDRVVAGISAHASCTMFDAVAAEVNAGVVTLTGKVTSPDTRQALVTRVGRLEGVSTVVNRIDVLPRSALDDELRYLISRAIFGNPGFWRYALTPSPAIHIVVEHGHVTLTGVVRDHMERLLAQFLASQFGALSVRSELKTDAEARPTRAVFPS